MYLYIILSNKSMILCVCVCLFVFNTILPINRCHLDPGLNPFLRGLSPSAPLPLSQETMYLPQLGVWEELLISAPLNLIRAATELDVPVLESCLL